MNNPIIVGNLGFAFIVIIYWIIILGLIGIAVYFIFTALRFFKQRTESDKEILNKLDELIRLQQVKQTDRDD